LEYRLGSAGWSPEPRAKKEFLRHLWCKMVVYESVGTGPVARKSCCPRVVRAG